MANYGGLRYTNVVFAEDEANLPAGWAPHGTERHGFAPGTSSISLAFANGATNIRRRGAKKETPEEDALQGMHRMADFMRVPNMAGLAGYEHGTPGILMIPGVVAQTMAGLGWTKASMREFLWEHSRIPAEQLRRAGGPAWIEIDTSKVARESLALDPWPITASPDNFVIVVAGGGHPTNSYWLQGYSPGVVGRAIELPSAFERLLADGRARPRTALGTLGDRRGPSRAATPAPRAPIAPPAGAAPPRRRDESRGAAPVPSSAASPRRPAARLPSRRSRPACRAARPTGRPAPRGRPLRDRVASSWATTDSMISHAPASPSWVMKAR